MSKFGIIWNPWHGCRKFSEGCRNCYMFYLDEIHGQNGANIYKVKNNFDLPLQKNKDGSYKIPSGEMVRICMTSDFFLEEADEWRNDIWNIIKFRSDILFFILTKRAHRIEKCLPPDWGNGYKNVFLNVTIENQKEADFRAPILLEIPALYKGFMAAPLLEELHIEKFLETEQILQVLVGGENYNGARPCDYDWIKSISDQCRKYNTTCEFIETGTIFIKDGKKYKIEDRKIQTQQAQKSNLSFKGKTITWRPVATAKQGSLFEGFSDKAKTKFRCVNCRGVSCPSFYKCKNGH